MSDVWANANERKSMTDRVYGFTVILEKDMRDDEIQHITDAIRMIRGVLDVKNNVSGPDNWCAQERAKAELAKKLWEALKPG